MFGCDSEYVCVCPIVCDLETSTMRRPRRDLCSCDTQTHPHTCQKYDEKSDHILAACTMLTMERCIKRYDRVCSQLCLKVRKVTGVKLNKEQWYERVAK